jgi:hypothetical protein
MKYFWKYSVGDLIAYYLAQNEESIKNKVAIIIYVLMVTDPDKFSEAVSNLHKLIDIDIYCLV